MSNIKDRLLFDNAENGAVNILNIDTNPPTLYQTTVAALTEPKLILRASDRSFLLIYDDSAFNLSYFSTSQETVTTSLAINYHTDSILMSSDNKHAYVAVPENPEQNAPTGAVLTFDLTSGVAGIQIPVPGARRLALSGDNNSLLVFADNNDSVYYIDLTATSLKAVPVAGFNRPYTALFASDNSTAYVLNCGTECTSATGPSIQPLVVTSKTQTPGVAVPVPGATVGYLNGTTLYVAGNDLTKPAGSQGVFTTFNVSNMTASASTQIPDGLHNSMSFINNKLWVGSWDCATTNCLAIADPSGSSATIPTTAGNVTAVHFAPKKNWVYVMQGGELYQFDPTALTYISPYDVIGQGWDMALLDQ